MAQTITLSVNAADPIALVDSLNEALRQLADDGVIDDVGGLGGWTWGPIQMTGQPLVRGDHVRHYRFGPAALWFVGHPPAIYYDATDDVPYHDGIDPTTAIVRMVGDDTDFEVATEDLERIEADDFCGNCGQIGCGHG